MHRDDEMSAKDNKLKSLMNLIKTWIETESGPTMMKVSIPDLKVAITIRGFKKIILERTFER
jgi:hypothetical protein